MLSYFAQRGQKLHRMAKRRRVLRLVQQAPDDYAGMVPVASDHADVAVIDQRGSVRCPGSVALLVDHEPDLVAQVELIALRHALEEPDHVQPHRLGVQQIAAEVVRDRA